MSEGFPEKDCEPEIRRAYEAADLDRAAREIIEAYGPEILGFLYARARSESDAREIFSIFVEDLWTGLPKFAWRCSARTWVYTLARNAATRYAAAPQRRARNNVSLSGMESASVVAERLRTETDLYRQTTVKDRFRLLREELSEEDQTLLVLRIDRGLAWRDLALAMSGDVDLDEGAVARESARLRKAFERIKEQLRALAARDGLLPEKD